mmetsp:Transcript_32699/g.75048  ORF Transcript_32699/g.75048 Transcript_32699/m.75048 type:complete len:326 (+) Transcript_32699:1848-2825(+)
MPRGKISCLIRPAERREREEARREPRVQHVFVLSQLNVLRAAVMLFHRLGSSLLHAGRHHRRRIHSLHLHVIRRDAVAPPQLTRDAPISDVIEPAVPRLLELFGHDLELPAAHSVCCSLGHSRTVHPPLWLEHRLDDIARARALAKAHLVVCLAAVQPHLLEALEHLHASIEAHHARECARVVCHLAIFSEHRDFRQSMAAAALEVVRVMRGGHLHSARAEVHVDKGRVEDHGDAAVDERVLKEAAVQLLVPRVVRMHRHRGISEHRLRPSRRHHQLFVRALHLVRKRPDDAKDVCPVLGMARDSEARALLDVVVVHLNVGDAGA